MSSLEYDEAICSDNECLHHVPPERNEVLYPQAVNVAPGFLSLEYAHGLDGPSLAEFHESGNRVSQVTLRMDCVEPQTGLTVQMTVVMPTSMAHHVGAEMMGAAFHHSSTDDDYWSPLRAEPDADGVRLAAAFYQTSEEDRHGDDDED